MNEPLDERPPFASWRAIYGLVLAALGVEIVVFIALTSAFR